MEQGGHGHVRSVFSLPVIVAALGYFVAIYDLVLERKTAKVIGRKDAQKNH